MARFLNPDVQAPFDLAARLEALRPAVEAAFAAQARHQAIEDWQHRQRARQEAQERAKRSMSETWRGNGR